MKITALQEYGMRVLLHLAEGKAEGESIRIRSIAEKEGISMDYVEKILVRLKKTGFVQSVRGVNGGYMLVKAPDQVTVAQAMRALTERPIQVEKLKKDLCGQFTGTHAKCVHVKGCAVRQLWMMVVAQVYSSLDRIRLSDLIGKESEVQGRLLQFMGRGPAKNTKEVNV